MKRALTILTFLLLVSSFTLAQAVNKNLPKVNKSKVVNSTKNTNAATYDFTTGSDKYYGNANGATEVESGVWGMIAGDGDGNGGINIDDRNAVWKVENGTLGYKNGDYDLNGGVNIDDRNLYWKVNNGKLSQVP